MEIEVAKNAGFCFGVKRAVETAEKLAKTNDKIYTYGHLIHNDYVINKLSEMGVTSIDNFDNLQEGDVVIIRSHGTTKDTFDLLKSKKVKVVDATCPFVNKIHKIVEEHYISGYNIIIFGEKSHPEIIGINGWCNNSAVILDDYDEKYFDPDKKICVVFQTTFPYEKFQKIEKKIANSNNLVVFFNTICYTTINRQEEINSMSKTADFVFVIGDKKSSNTNKLINISKQNNPNTFLIETPIDAMSIRNKMKSNSKLVITAGASTPYELIKEVVANMSDTQEQKNLTTDAIEEATHQDEAITMDDVMESVMTEYKEGKKVKATVISANEEGICVNIGAKKDGFIEASEAELDQEYNPANYKEGDEVEAIIIKAKDTSRVALSKKKVDAIKKNDEEVEKILNGEEFTLIPTKATKGGLLGKIGSYSVFIPASQIRLGFVKEEELEKYVGKKLRLVQLPKKDGEEKKGNSKTIKASQKIILEKEKAEKEEAFWSSMVVGEVVTGKVKRFAEFGAFVNVKGYDCLAHISDLSWSKIEKPGDVLKLNETYEFLILKVDRENNRVSLGYKQLQKKPYEIAAEMYPVGSVIKGTVERIFPFGAFVKIADGVDGLVHVSQISHEWIKDANDALKVGQEVEAKVISFEDNKITLSIKELLPEPEKVEEVISEVEVEPVEKVEKKRAPRQSKMNFDVNFEKPKKAKKEVKEEATEWKSDNGFTSLGDLLKGLNLDLSDDEN